jgi:hypothetical protein
MSRTAPATFAALSLLFWSSAVATADPVAPQADTPCPVSAAGAMTLLPDGKTPMVCRDQRWQSAANPSPPSDRWLSYGPAMTLHGEGLRNPEVRSGTWTATPQDADGRCRAEQSAVLGPGVVGAPETAEGKPGQPLQLQVLPRLFSITLNGYCLWERKA